MGRAMERHKKPEGDSLTVRVKEWSQRNGSGVMLVHVILRLIDGVGTCFITFVDRKPNKLKALV